MASNSVRYWITLVVISFSTMRSMNGAWISTNVSHFCAVANNCIESQADSVTLEDNKVGKKKTYEVCTAHERHCDPSSNDTDVSDTVPIHDDKNTFCRLILSCYEQSLTLGPTVDVSKLCPYAQFCNQHPSSGIDDENIENSCCIPCSCEPTCGHSNNCCYSHNASYNAVESEGLKCIRMNKLSVYVQDTCLNGSTCRYSRELVVPASSKEKQRIYISKGCGDCNNAPDAIEWEAIESCRSAGCNRYVQLPEQVDLQLVKNYICNATRTCDPRYGNEAVKELCRTVNANKVIVYTQIFANIFCVACNFYMEHYQPTRSCEFKDYMIQPKSGGLTILLDTSVDRMNIKDSQHSTGALDDTCLAYMLKSIGQPGCRRVFCPREMVRVKDGSCRYVGKKWYNIRPALQVRLLPREGAIILTSTLRKVSRNDDIKQWMLSPCLSWEEAMQYGVAMLTRDISRRDRVVEIIVQIILPQGDITPATFVPEWAKCLDDSWTLVIGTRKYPLSPSIYPGEQITTAYETIYRTIILDMWTISFTVLFSKAFFCDQVELNSDEYEDMGDEIRILHNNVTFGFSEYYKSYVASSDSYNRYVCVEDYDPESVHDPVNTALQISSSVLVVCVWITRGVLY